MSGPIMSKTILFVSGFSTNLRAKDLAYEFERYGRLIRCDIPALKSPSASPYAFIEFRSEACAEDAYFDMHGRSIDGRRISVQWAKSSPGNSWRYEAGSGGGPPPPRGRPPQDRDSRRRSRSPVASSRRDAPRERERQRSRSRSRSRSPVRKEGSAAAAREGSAARSEKSRGVDEREVRDREEDEGRKRREGTGDDE